VINRLYTFDVYVILQNTIYNSIFIDRCLISGPKRIIIKHHFSFPNEKPCLMAISFIELNSMQPNSEGKRCKN